MKRTKILYWTFTGLFSAFMISTAIPNIMISEDSITLFTSLGYPTYLIPFLGVAKILGSIAILIPGFNRIKEWAYAGLFFDLAGATYSVIYSEGFQMPILFMIVPFGLFVGSYLCQRKLSDGNTTL
ncbi:MAG: DoxX family protein [Cyclobacteriaceae bacterium]|nr:DoxX family protein [Cyclobacteriaceae bacterium]